MSEAQKLGSKASHGCIRLALPDAKWIYQNIRVGSRVVITP
jgi:lipoprotein-anchoring transpeptidase ErfK/SrfK